MSTAFNTIDLGANSRRDEKPTGASGVKPGHLVKRNSSDQVVVHADQGGYAARLFVAEDALQGDTVDDTYTSGAVATIIMAQPGDIIYAMLDGGVSYSVGDLLCSNGDGTLCKTSLVASGVTVNQVLGVVREAVDLSASGVASGLGWIEVV